MTGWGCNSLRLRSGPTPILSAQDDKEECRNSHFWNAQPPLIVILSEELGSESKNLFRCKVFAKKPRPKRVTSPLVSGDDTRNRYRENSRPAIGYGDPSTPLLSAQDDKEVGGNSHFWNAQPPLIVILSEELGSESKNLFRCKVFAKKPRPKRVTSPLVSGDDTRNRYRENSRPAIGYGDPSTPLLSAQDDKEVSPPKGIPSFLHFQPYFVKFT